MGDVWHEVKERKVGTVIMRDERHYSESDRTDDFVELVNAQRSVTVRLYADHYEWRIGRFGGWNRDLDGGWADLAKGEEQ